jgi:outer membrane lipoprotein-sorting protein
MRLTIPVAAAVFVALGGLWYFGSAMSGTRAVAWAQVVEKVSDARTLTYRSTIQTAGQTTPVTGKYFFKVPSHIRLESSNGLTMIIDGNPGNELFLRPANKTAFFPNRKKPKPGGVTGTFHAGPQVIDQKPADKGRIEFSGFDKLKNIASDKAEPIGEKSIGGVRAQGFRVQQNGETLTVWVHPKTSLPLVIEQKFRAGDREVTTTMTDFVFDPKLDDSLFSLDVPPGYELRDE